MFLEQSVATTVRMGPFLDDTDGKTPETALTIANTDIKISEDGAAFASKSTGGATHDADGWYSFSLGSTDTNLPGILEVYIDVSGALPVWKTFYVVSTAVYAAMFSSTATSLPSVAPSNWIGVASLAANSLTASALALDAKNEIVDGVWDELQVDHVLNNSMGRALNSNVMHSAQLGTVTSQTVFTIGTGSTVDDVYNGAVVVITDAGDPTVKAAGIVLDYVGSTKTVTLEADPGIFTMAGFDKIDFLIPPQAAGAVRAGYDLGRIYVDTVNGTAGAVDFVNGTADNPVSTFSDARTLATSLGLESFHIINGSSITLGSTSSNWSFYGNNWTMTLNGWTIASTYIEGATVSGTSFGAGAHFKDCIVNSVTLDSPRLENCRIAGTHTLSGTAITHYENCRGSSATLPVIDLGAAIGAGDVDLTNYNGGVEFHNIETGDNVSVHGNGEVIINANAGGGDLEYSGSLSVTNNGSTTVTALASSSAPTAAEIADQVWDEVQADHVTVGSFGEVATEVASVLVDTAAIGPDVTLILADTNELQTDDVPGLIAALNDPTAAAVADAVWDETQAAHVTGGTFGEVATEVASILADTNELQTDDIPGAIAALNDISTAEVATELATYDGPTNTEMVAAFTEIKGATWAATDSLEAIRDRGDAAWVTGAGGSPPQLLQSTTIATLASQISFTLTAGSADDDAYNGAIIVITDSVTATQKAVGLISDTGGYVGSTKTIALDADPAIYTMAVGDTVEIIAALGAAGSAPSAAAVADAVWDEDIIAAHTTADTAGLILGTNIPSSVGSIGAGSGGSVNIEATEDNTAGAIIDAVTFVGSVQGATTFANTESIDGVYHDIDDTVDDIDIVYGFDIGGARLGTSVTFAGFVQGGTDEMKIKVYDHVGADWEIIGTVSGTNGTDNTIIEAPLLTKHTGTLTELGKVYIRLETDGTTPSNLSVDSLIVSAVNVGQSVGYDGGQVWIDTTHGVAGTEAFVNGVADNPVDTIAAAFTIAAAIGIENYHIANESNITLAADSEGRTFTGLGSTLALGGQNIGGSVFREFGQISGIGTTTSNPAFFENCFFTSATIPNSVHQDVSWSGTLTLSVAGNYDFRDCSSSVAGSGAPTLDMGAAVGASNISIRRWSGGLTINNLAAGDVVSVDVVSGGIITLNGADAEVYVRGICKVVNNLTGTPTVDTDSVMDERFDIVDAAVAVVDGNVDSVLVDTGTTVPAQITALESKVDIIDTTADAILVDTNELQTDDIPTLIAAIPAAPTAAVVADAVWDETQAAHVTSGSFGEVATEVASILADTNELQTDDIPGVIAALNDPTAAVIADAVWDETQVAHTAAGSFGEVATEVASILVDTGTTLQTDITAILADTNELQTDDVPGLIAALNDPTAAAVADAVWDETQAAHVAVGSFGELGTEIASILVDTNELQTDDVPGLIAALNDIATSDVLAQVNAALDTAIAELGVGAPTATPTLRTGLMLMYMLNRNKLDVTNAAKEIHNAAGTVIATKVLTDDTVTYSETSMS